MNLWNEMFNKAKQVQNARTISPFIDAGGVAAAILTASNNIYVGVCIDTSSSLGMCAERNAIANMITNGESKITKVLAIMPDGKVGPPCGACREFMMQLNKDSKDIDVLMDYDTLETVKLGDLCPNWWTDSRFN
ncbi:cytidine deaminase family protein [Anaerocolumna sp. MB42-C2]|uniref:cytidine deaminase family protein n=1 Tax=Anaerocolumna sp. MB42-C2 TaxID=3070997 RepID=UPI0027E01C18|nr:cytidine deaminase [Anaerocolumna sp. MB42-C2]WMJ86029.1 cytidine deaminase [Anaerocolumna sp. MB42-C2]